MKTFISFSGGVESSTMCILFGNKADAIFADTGFEHKLIYEQIDKIEKFCKKFHRKDFTIHRIKSKYGTLPGRIKELKFYPSFKSRYCTYDFKIKPIDDFLMKYADEGVELMIGLNYDEQNRYMLDKGHGNNKFIKYKYPLIENKINREFCHKILNKVGLNPKYPAYMKRGGCIGCFYKSAKCYEAMALLAPDDFKIVEDLEIELNKLLDREKYWKILGENSPSMTYIREMANMQLFKPEEVYATINDVTQCGVFCNR